MKITFFNGDHLTHATVTTHNPFITYASYSAVRASLCGKRFCKCTMKVFVEGVRASLEPSDGYLFVVEEMGTADIVGGA